eukprot:CAMPEP_0180044588 /NCGR_PEP_ID=MMETSP0984-20121128/36005_1 /TAXON_ID=483367 /ORGANISM="non described non described, Strain CCMP 2436" /LENGTH=282 /DNA_ID=CAMNT_0021972769 /DNA_START=94 /DNA_END=939 /DNA_ORIENTATION=+
MDPTAHLVPPAGGDGDLHDGRVCTFKGSLRLGGRHRTRRHRSGSWAIIISRTADRARVLPRADAQHLGGAPRACEFAQACDPLAVLRPRPLDCEAFIPGFFGTLLNVLLLPLLLPYNALAIYLLPCVVAYARRLLGALSYLLCFPCRAAWPDFCLFKFHDREFPPSASSIGARNGKSDASWALASELALGAAKFSKREKNAVSSWDRPCLFNRGPDASDIDQGGLGDCWLMSAFACAAEVPGLIQGVFVTPNFNPRGMYQVRLFDGNAKRWVLITIDEWIPA